MATRIFVSAGETSGDRHLASLLGSLAPTHGPLDLVGLGGPRLEAQGARLLAGIDELSVIGFSDVLRRLPFFRRLMNRCLEVLDRERPDLLLLADYPGFNLRLGRRARQRGHRVMYYIAPQIWAWKRERRPGIARSVDHMMVVFPFEEPLFQEAGIPVTFVGHPLLDAPSPEPPPAVVRQTLEIPAEAPLLALLPGSRPGEVKHILPALVAGARALGQERGLRVAVSRRRGLPPELFREAKEAGFALWDGDAAALARASDAAVVASGTATLETGLGGTPLAVVYRTGVLNWQIARRVVSIRTVGLVNIAAGGNLVPELLQGDLTAGNVASTARRILFDEETRDEQKLYLARLRDCLGGNGAAARAAQVVGAFIEEGRHGG